MKLRFINRKLIDGALMGFIIAMIITLFSSINTIRYIYTMQQDLRSWYEKDLVGQNSIQIARGNLLSLDRDLKVIILAGNGAESGTSYQNIIKHRSAFIRQMAIARPLFTAGEAANELEIAYRLGKECLAMLDSILTRPAAERIRAIFLAHRELSSRFEAIDRVLDKLDDIKQENDLRVYRNIIAQHEITLAISLVVLIVSVAYRVYQLSADRKKINLGNYL